MLHRLLLATLLFAACSTDGIETHDDLSTHDMIVYPPGKGPLGMNDVSLLVPLPASTSVPIVALASDLAVDGNALVERGLWDRIILGADGMAEVFADYRTLQLVAVRFDLCSRHDPGACPTDADGQLRLVLQTIDSVGADDVSVHALFVVPHDELGSMVGQLRGLASMATGARTAPLQPSPSLVAKPSGEYAARLRSLVLGMATHDRLRRVTFLAQPGTVSSVHWEMRGLDRSNAQEDFAPLDIPTLGAQREGTTLVGTDSFELVPPIDDPPGLVLAISSTNFAAATPTAQASALDALAITENPMKRTADTVQCAACHVATVSAAKRSAETGVPFLTAPSRYTSTYDLSVAAGSNLTSDRTLRMFGWLGTDAFIGQRVANDTAQALVEMESRYPAAP